MSTTRNRNPLLVGLTVGLILAVLISPATRYIAVTEVKMVLHLSSKPSEQSYQQVISEHPNDFQVQVANAWAQSQKDNRQVDSASARSVQAFTDLTRRFPDNPSGYANGIRRLTMVGGVIGYSRDPAHYPSTKPEVSRDNNMVAVQALYEFAQKGECLDSDNAFFPMMQAVGLYAMKRDEDAIAAIKRAGAMNHWQSYYSDEVNGQWRISELQNGPLTAINRISVMASQMYPHLAPLREVSRIAVCHAIDLEQAGNYEQGYQIRHALRRVGDNLRINGTTVIDCLVGIAVTNITLTRMGGGPYEQIKSEDDAERQSIYMSRATEYLNRIGHHDEIAAYQAHYDGYNTVRSVQRRTGDWFLLMFKSLIWYWVVACCLFTNVLITALLGLAALVAFRFACIRKSQPMPMPVKWGVFTVVAGTLVLYCLSDPQYPVAFAIVPLIIAISIIMFLQHRASSRLGATPTASQPKVNRWITLLRYIGGCAVSFAIPAAMAVWLGSQQVLGQFSWVDGTNGDTSALNILWICACFAVPVLLTLITIAFSRSLKLPLSVGVARGLRRISLPLTCVMLMAWCLLVAATANPESHSTDMIKAMQQGELQYESQKIHQPLPDHIP